MQKHISFMAIWIAISMI